MKAALAGSFAVQGMLEARADAIAVNIARTACGETPVTVIAPPDRSV
ncbi:MAG TPA: hypothetical protein VGM09_04155 [Bradyrhizobium sp.]